MRDKKLIAFVLLAALLLTIHLIDHILRGDFPLPLNGDSLVFILVSTILYSLIGVGLWLYWKKKIGPRYWTILAALGVAFGWLAHFSPFTDEGPAHIRGAYATPLGGWLALAVLVALMLVMIVGALYAGYLWMVGVKQRR